VWWCRENRRIHRRGAEDTETKVQSRISANSAGDLLLLFGKKLPVLVPALLDIGAVVAVGDSDRGQLSEFIYQQSVGGEES